MRVAFAIVLMGGLASAAPVDPNSAPSRLIGAAIGGENAYAIAQSLSDGVGQRIAGSAQSEKAIAWAEAEMKSLGLERVHREAVKVPHWVRGAESLEVVSPEFMVGRALHVAALGGSIGTSPDGLSGEIVEVDSFDALKALGDAVRGKIVFFNKAMQRTQDFVGYGSVVGLRGHGAVAAAKQGAIGAIIRSVGTAGNQLVHTGATRYDDGVEKIPFAAVSLEDADLLHRLLSRSSAVKIKLTLGAKFLPEVDSFSVVGEVRGSERPNEIVLIGAHLDSWDLGAGAIDDAAGCGIVLETARMLAHLKPRLRRTLRVVLYQNEEYGLSGARAYALAHQSELAAHVAAIEADSGAGRALGYGVVGDAKSVELMKKLTAPMAGLHLLPVRMADEMGADLIPLQERGVPILGVDQDVSRYFDWHHTAADTMDKIDPLEIAQATAAFAGLTWSIADSIERLPASKPAPKW